MRPFFVCSKKKRELAQSQTSYIQYTKPTKKKVKTYHVDMPLGAQRHNLLLRQAGETKHSNLRSNMIPRARRTPFLKTVSQSLSHVQNATTHRTQIRLPLLKELGIIQHATSNTRTVSRRVGDLRSLQNSKLGSDVRGRSSRVRTRSRDKVESASALTVKTEVLSERLRDAQLEALLDEVADCPGVADQVAGCEALVCGIEEGEVRAGAH